VTLPGPTEPFWGGALALFALAIAAFGEVVRVGLARAVPRLRSLEPIERGLLDLYLGGAVFYVLAALPLHAFTPLVLGAVVVAAGLGVVLWLRPATHRRRLGEDAQRTGAALRRPPYVLTLLAVLGLFAVELAAIQDVPTGNTYDASLLTLYTSLLLAHHTLPLSLLPVASQGIVYPQGTTVWLGLAQLAFQLPPARTSLLVTPLFLALAPLGAFVIGRLYLASEAAGAGLALVVALLGEWTRALVGGSNDFVFAIPLVLLLAGWTRGWIGPDPPSWRDALAWGSLAGYAAALNPVGSEWLFVLLPVLVVFAGRRRGKAWLAWSGRWWAALGSALVFVLPSIVVLAADRWAPAWFGGGSAVAAPGGVGLNVAQFLGASDPFLFRPTDQWLSSFPLLRIELALLLVVGAGLLVLGLRSDARLRAAGRFLLAGILAALGLLALGIPASQGVEPFRTLAEVTSSAEQSILLFLLYTLLAGLPVAWLLDRALDSSPTNRAAEPPSRRGRIARRSRGVPPAAAAVAVALLLVPGAVVTGSALAPQLTNLYERFSIVSAADFALLAWAATHLAAGERVLVAPGSVAEFLPGSNPNLVLLYPMTTQGRVGNASYVLVVEELTNGTLDARGVAALDVLDVQAIAVTQANSVLYRAFDAAPLLAAGATVAFHADDAYVLDWPPPALAPAQPA
jgi:hypothetical protein